MNICNEIQQKITELEFHQTIDNQDQLAHIKTCPACQDFQQAFEEMNHAMIGLGEFDADEALVEGTLNSILSLQNETKKPKLLLNTQWASGLAASFVLISLIALFPYNSISNFGMFSDVDVGTNQLEVVTEQERKNIKKRKEALSKPKQDNSTIEFIEVDVAHEVVNKQRRIPKKPSPSSNRVKIEPQNSIVGAIGDMDAITTESDDSLKSLAEKMQYELNKEFKNEINKSIQISHFRGAKKPKNKEVGDFVEDEKVELDKVTVTGSRINRKDLESPSVVVVIDSDQRQDEIVSSDKIIYELEEAKVQDMTVEADDITDNNLMSDSVEESFVSAEKRNQKIRQSIAQRRKQMRDEAKFSDKEVSATEKGSGVEFVISNSTSANIENPNSLMSPASKFLAELNSLDNIAYQSATGYWANNYLPGDANMRLLAGKLINNNVDIESIVEQNRQPFDYPTNSALAVYLSSDRANVNAREPTRMKLQVGIQASNRKGGHRSAMNIGLVFDLADYSKESIEKTKALLLALLKAKQPSDNISVIFAGNKGGELIKAKEFRYGTIQTTLNSLALSQDKSNNVSLSLHEAIKLSTVNLQQDDDPSASLGSSVVMLVSDKIIQNFADINSTIHKNAVDGITLSTISLGNDNHQLNQLALTGQGHVRTLKNANDANRVIDAEMLASSRAVARALRLRIRLAKGVKLIKVLDSYNLNENQAQRVRDAEKSLDKRLSKNLGIQADRGKDEEGIQIVIPSFYAGDTHVVILDVEVNNPGAIADVSLRYKDLLYLNNAISRKQLNLGSDEKPIGPLQLNVIKNVLANRFANDIKKASIALNKGNNLTALSHLVSLQKLYQSMRQEFPAWNNDEVIIKDEKLIQQYIDLINQSEIRDAQQVSYIVDSLQYISWRKNITQSK